MTPTTIHPTEEKTGLREVKGAALRGQGNLCQVGSVGQTFPFFFRDWEAEAQRGRPRPRCPRRGSALCQCRAYLPGQVSPVGLYTRATRLTLTDQNRDTWAESGDPGLTEPPGRPAGLETLEGVHPVTGSEAGAPCPLSFLPIAHSPPANKSITLAALHCCLCNSGGPAQPPTDRQFLERLQWELLPSQPRSPAACGGQTSSPGPLWDHSHFQENCKTFEEQMVNSS